MSPTRTDGKARRSVLRKRASLALLAGFVLLSTAGCSTEDLPRLGWPTAAVAETERSLWLWQTIWVAAFVVGGITLILILWPSLVWRRKAGDPAPVQTRYNLPIEILYTVVPVIIIAVIFGYTARDQNVLTRLSDNPQNTVNVVGFQWNWTFNYVDDNTYDIGTPDDRAVLYLPVNETTRFDLTSPDVIHSFWVPSFLFKMDVVPGRTNQFEMTPDRIGVYRGYCAELCGVDHARMLFDVHVVSRDDYDAHIAERKAAGAVGLLDSGRYSTNTDGKQGRVEINRDPSPKPYTPAPTAASGSNQ